MKKSMMICNIECLKESGKINDDDYNLLFRNLLDNDHREQDIMERKELLDWLEYNDTLYFEKIKRSNEDETRGFYFQKYISMPLNELRDLVHQKKNLS